MIYDLRMYDVRRIYDLQMYDVRRMYDLRMYDVRRKSGSNAAFSCIVLRTCSVASQRLLSFGRLVCFARVVPAALNDGLMKIQQPIFNFQFSILNYFILFAKKNAKKFAYVQFLL